MADEPPVSLDAADAGSDVAPSWGSGGEGGWAEEAEETPPVEQMLNAAAEGQAEAVAALLDGRSYGYDPIPVNATGVAGTTALMDAAQAGSTEVLELLLERGASLRVADPIGWTALHYASFNGQVAAAAAGLSSSAACERY